MFPSDQGQIQGLDPALTRAQSSAHCTATQTQQEAAMASSPTPAPLRPQRGAAQTAGQQSLFAQLGFFRSGPKPMSLGGFLVS